MNLVCKRKPLNELFRQYDTSGYIYQLKIAVSTGQYGMVYFADFLQSFTGFS